LQRIKSLNKLDLAIMVMGMAMVLYHLVYVRWMWQGPIEHQAFHLLFGLVIVYLIALKKYKKHWPWLFLLLLVSIITTGYIKYFYPELEERMGMPTTPDLIIGILLLVVCFVAVLYSVSKILPIVALIFIAYTFLGQYVPGVFWHFPISLKTIISMYNIGLKGMFGMVLGVSANYIFLFLVLGAMLKTSGAIGFFNQVGRLAGRRLAGGAGMTAVISSALVGTVTGTGAANVAVTGPFTIPLMKRVGYTAEQAAGIETVASAGGNIMPPIMGIVAFVMAEYMRVPYIQVCAMAVIPALLYYFCIGLFVQLNALKRGIKPLPEEVDYRLLITRAPLFIIPLATMIVLLMRGSSLMLTAFASICVLVFLSLLRKETRGSFATWVNACVDGAKTGAMIAVTCSIVGIIVASIGVTGLGLRFPLIVEALSGGVLVRGLVLVAVMMIILGCGIPPMTSYLIGAMLAVPALVRMGLAVTSAHFFMFYFAVFGLITPPVALTAVVAAPIAGANYLKTSIEAVKAGVIAWFLPFMLVWSPGLILQPQEPMEMITKLIASFLLVLLLQVALTNHYFIHLNPGERGIAVVCVGALIYFIVTGNFMLLATGLIIGTLLTLWQWRKSRLIRSAAGQKGPTQLRRYEKGSFEEDLHR